MASDTPTRTFPVAPSDPTPDPKPAPDPTPDPKPAKPAKPAKDKDPIVEAAKAQAAARLATAKAAVETAAELVELAGKPMAALNRPIEDVLGRKLPDDPDEARIQQREAQAIREGRVAVDVAREQRGLKTKYATT